MQELTALLQALDNASGGFSNPNSVAVVLTWGNVALLGIVGFVVGLCSSITFVLYRRTYGIMIKILREVGYSYKQVYNKKLTANATEFRYKKRTYQVDLSRTAWMDENNRPVLIYEKETTTPVSVKNTKAKLEATIKAMKIEMSKKGMRPSDPFDLLFGRKLIEALFASMRRKTKVSSGIIAAFVVIIILTGVLMYFVGNIFPVVHIASSTATSTSTTSTTVTNGGNPFG